MARFDIFNAERQKASAQTNGHSTTVKPDSSASPATEAATPLVATKHKSEEGDEDLSEVQDSPAPKKKKRKVDYDSDAAFAAKLQAQENGRIRSTRGGGPKAPAVKKKKTPKKTSSKVKAEDDSDLDGSDGAKEKKVNRSGGFHVCSSLNALTHVCPTN